MKHLPYCIMCADAVPQGELPRGIDGRPVQVLADGELAVAFSAVSDSLCSPNLLRLAAYAEAVRALHELSTVLPLQYGCFLPSREHLVNLLRARRCELLALLERVRGCHEMCIRILPDVHGGPAEPAESQVSLAREGRGTAYLAGRRQYYWQVDRSRRQAATLSQMWQARLEGLYLECRTEFGVAPAVRRAGSSGPTLCIYFLVPRQREGDFRARFRTLMRRESARALLSGPWPPYNFVTAQMSSVPNQGTPQ